MPAQTRKHAPRRGSPRSQAPLGTGNPFAASSRLGTGYDDTPRGYTDMRSNVPPTYEMKVPARVSMWRGPDR